MLNPTHASEQKWSKKKNLQKHGLKAEMKAIFNQLNCLSCAFYGDGLSPIKSFKSLTVHISSFLLLLLLLTQLTFQSRIYSQSIQKKFNSPYRNTFFGTAAFVVKHMQFRQGKKLLKSELALHKNRNNEKSKFHQK